MRYWIILWHIICLPFWAGAQVCGLEDTLWINPNATHLYNIQIAGLVNNDLSSPTQGICGVEIEFVHQFSENLELWLTAPNGTTVQLIGPNTDDELAFTFFARWDITFVPCSATAMPDLGYAAQWNNNQILNFVSGGRYFGSYYPYSGCLENFASGPVNGNWTLTVVNNPSPFYGGAILDFRLIFCDDRGVDCCLADAGVFLPVPGLVVCQGADTLSRLPLIPRYFGRRPDSLLFGYNYVIAQQGVLVAYDASSSLGAYPPGNYEICGLSFERATAGDILPVDGMLTLDSLRRNLDSFSPSFCGELTPACATVIVVAPPDTTFLRETICFGDTAFVAGSPYTATGIYTQRLAGRGGCDSIVQLDLVVRPLLFTSLNITICEGDSVVIGNTAYFQSGHYAQTLLASTLCDSVVELNLTVLQPIFVVLDTVICSGDTLTVGALRFWETGSYTVPLRSFQGCDSIVTLNLMVFTSQAIIAEPALLTCSQPQITLNGSGSIPASGMRYIWLNALGDSIGGGPGFTVALPGLYILEIRPQTGFPQCAQRDSVIVVENRTLPIADAGPDGTLICGINSIQLGGSLTSTGPQFTHTWTTNTGNILTPVNQPIATANSAGRYILTTRDILNGCSAADTVFLAVDTLPPPALAGIDMPLTCVERNLILDGSASGAGLGYLWSGPCITTASAQAAVEVNCAGEYVLRVTNPINACIAFDTIIVSWDTLPPIPNAGVPQTINCSNPEVVLMGSVVAGGNNLSFSWTGPGLVSGANTLMPRVNEPGTYAFEVLDSGTGCRDTATVSVIIDTLRPVSDAGLDQRINCLFREVQLGGPGTTPGPSIRYEWSTIGGNLSGPINQPLTRADAGGVYILVVENTVSGCADTSNVLVILDITPPFVDAGEPFILDCQIREAILDGSDSEAGPLITYAWEGPCLFGSQHTPIGLADCQGLYTLTVTNIENGCAASDTVSVLLALATAIAVLPDTVRLSCETGTALIDGALSVFGVFEWQYNGAPANISEISPAVSRPGVYVLSVNTLALNCPDSDTTIVVLNCIVNALIAPPNTLTCNQATITLDGTASSSGPGLTYQWVGPAPGCIVTGQGTRQVQVSCPGVYKLIVTNTLVGVADTAMVTVMADQIVPLAEAGNTDTITCIRPFGVLNGSASSSGFQYLYIWTDAGGNIISNSMTDTVTAPGAYFLEVLDTVNGCNALDFVTIAQQTDPPVVNFGNAIFPCNRDSFLLRAFPEPQGLPYSFAWSGPGLLSGGHTAAVWIDTAGLYVITVVNTTTGCSVTDSIVVVHPECGPCISISPPDSITCIVQNVVLQASFCEPCPGCVISWSAVSGQIISGGNTLNPRVEEGIYTLTVTDTAGITARLTVEVIKNNTLPVADAGPDRMINCREAAVMLGSPNTASGPQIRYTWSSAGGAIVTPAGGAFGIVDRADTFVLEVMDMANGCFSMDTVQVGLDTIAPVAEAGPDKLITCAAPFAIPDGEGSSLGNFIAYRWTTSTPGIIAAGETTLNPIVSTAGVYRLEVTNIRNGCTAVDSMRVGIADQLPFVPNVPDQLLTCADSILLVTANLPDTAGFTYQWCRVAAGNVSVDCMPGLTRSIVAPGTYRFEITEILTGCRNADFVVVSENKSLPLADAGIAPGMLSCTQTSLTLSGTAGPAGVPLEILWSASAGSMVQPVDGLNPVINTPDTYFLTVIRLDNGCSATDSVVILLNDNFPVANAGPDTALTCRLTELRLQGEAIATGAPVQWSWTTTNGRILEGADTPNPRINSAGRYILQITDPANGCTASDTVLVVIEQTRPVIQISAPLGLSLNCATDTLLLDAQLTVSGGPLRFRWSGAPGSIVGSVDSPAVRVSGVGFYRLVAEDTSNGCRDTTLIQIGGNFERPSVSVVGPQPVTCTRTAVELHATASIPGAFLQTTWILPGGDTIRGNDLNQLADRPGLYRLGVTDIRNGCVGWASVVVGQDTAAPVARVAQPDELDCDQRIVILNGSASTGRGDLSFQWTGPPGGILSGGETSSARAGRAGWYLLVVTDPVNGCRDTVDVEVKELSAPIVGLLIELEQPSCPGAADGAIQVIDIEGGIGPYSFALNAGSPSGVREFSNLLPGNYTLTVRDALGCFLDTTIRVTDPPVLTVDLGRDTLLRLGDSLVLEAITNLPVVRYQWAPADLLPMADGPVQLVRPIVTTTYQVKVQNSNGCTATDWVTLSVSTENLYFVPNAFSPNGDGLNDVFLIFAGSAVEMIRSLRIFDRWGNLVFLRQNFPANDPALGWDGVFDGRMLNPAVFVVMAELQLRNGRIEVFSGDLTLLR